MEKVVFIVIALAIIGGFTILPILYFKKGWFKRLYHDILGWHYPDDSEECHFDGCSLHSVCKHCGENIMQDSQGNWF